MRLGPEGVGSARRVDDADALRRLSAPPICSMRACQERAGPASESGRRLALTPADSEVGARSRPASEEGCWMIAGAGRGVLELPPEFHRQRPAIPREQVHADPLCLLLYSPSSLSPLNHHVRLLLASTRSGAS